MIHEIFSIKNIVRLNLATPLFGDTGITAATPCEAKCCSGNLQARLTELFF